MWIGLLKAETGLRNWDSNPYWDSISLSKFLVSWGWSTTRMQTRTQAGKTTTTWCFRTHAFEILPTASPFLLLSASYTPAVCGAAIFLSQNSAFSSNYNGIHVTKVPRKTLGIVKLFERAVLLSYLSVSLERLSVCVGMLEYRMCWWTCLNWYVGSESSALSPAGRMG